MHNSWRIDTFCRLVGYVMIRHHGELHATSKSFSFVLTLNILWFSVSTCYDESVIHFAPHRTEHASFLTFQKVV